MSAKVVAKAVWKQSIEEEQETVQSGWAATDPVPQDWDSVKRSASVQ